MPQLYDLHGKLYDALSKKSNSSNKYECLVLAPSLSYLHDVVGECNATLDASEDGKLSYDELQKRFHAVINSVHGVYAMLCNRSWRDRVYQAADGVVADEVLQQWLNDFDKNRGKAVLSASSKSAANADARVVKDHRDQRSKEKYDDEKDSKKPSGKGGEAAEGCMARSGRQFRGDAVDHSREEVEVEARASASVRPRSVTDGCDATATGMAGRGEEEAAGERLAKPGDWCFGFDLQDGFHALGIHPDFQQFMQFDLQGELFQCSAILFGWNDPPRVFCKFVRVMVEALRSPQAAEDCREIKKLRMVPWYDSDGQSVAEQEALAGTRTGTTGCAYCLQVVEHLGLEVDLKLGQFRVTERRVRKIHVKAKEILCDAARSRRWIAAWRLPAFTGLCQSVYLAVPAARLYLRELYFVLAEKRSWGAKVKISRAARVDLEWWSKLPVMSRWNGRKIWRSPTRAKLHTDSSMVAWGGMLTLKYPARGFWPDEMRNWHITHLKLEAVYKTVQAFLKELESKVVRLYCDNQAVVAMLSHFTSKNLDLMRRMRRLWSLLDLHDIELQARYIRSEANVWADNLSRCEDLDDWRLNRKWFEWASEQWGPFTVDRFASEISAQLPRYYATWKDPRCESVDSLAYDWRGENSCVNPPWALLDEVAHKLREEGAAATVVAPYWLGQSWFRELEALATEVVIMPCEVV
ncbi:hypothetical protein CYMTET_56809 [Cymbomonas tetramitiformis]|uniref:EF-hand domain-containing protein n=1 Tax=Cymbomonas tetramitiformis TaxID=36881 RepID=A0AAE0BBP0_9CHLO|nr:hypothetical protein CYMTET_56809 [Cymbomonas tetramitiformis]